MVESGHHCCQRSHGSYQFRCDHFSCKCRQIVETFRYGGSGRTSRLAWANRSTWFCGSLAQVKQMSGKCFQTILIWAPFLIDKDFCLQHQLTSEKRRLRVFRHSCCRASGSSSRGRIPRSLWWFRLLLRRATSKEKWFGNNTICAWPWQRTKSLVENTFFFWDQNQEDSVRPFFAHVPWMDDFFTFSERSVEPESTTKVTPTRTGKNPRVQIEMWWVRNCAKDSTRAVSSNN